MDVFVAGKRFRLDPTQAVGKGGEADVYRIAPDRALKLWKGPDHPDLAGLDLEQEAARRRLDVYGAKLGAFPTSLPARVVLPEEPATDKSGRRVLGYTMRFIDHAEMLVRYADRGFRAGGIDTDQVRAALLDLHATVAGLHAARVVIGDFNDLNVLVRGAEAWVIDADSFQFGAYPCTVFSTRFVDPILCDPHAASPMLQRPHNPESDWYAFTVMLMQCLLFVGPYGGIHRPADPARRVPHDARPLRRITVFDSEVRWPKPALPAAVLPDDLLHHLQEVFVRDRRGEFPRRLLENLRWTRCAACGAEHGRATCPQCACAVLVAAVPAATVRGTVVASECFRTRGRILCAAWQEGKLRWLSHDGEAFLREDGRAVLRGPLDPHMRFRLRGEETLLARGRQLVRLNPGREPERLSVDLCGSAPAFDAAPRAAYWIDQGRLLRDGAFGPELVGETLAGQTLFWAGAKLGFGFYRAAGLRVGFVFRPDRAGLDDSVALPPLRGTLVAADCALDDERAWFFAATEEGGRTVVRALVVRADGSVEASAEAEEGAEPWLSARPGKLASGGALFVPLDEGIVRIEARGGRLVRTRDFPDTEPFVDAGCRLLPGPQGIHVVTPQEIRFLRLS